MTTPFLVLEGGGGKRVVRRGFAVFVPDDFCDVGRVGAVVADEGGVTCFVDDQAFDGLDCH